MCYNIVELQLCFVHVQVKKMALQMKPYRFQEAPRETSKTRKVMGWCTAQHKLLLFCVKTTMKESCNFELACLKKKKKKKKETKTLWLSSDFLVWYFCDAFSCH